MEDTHMPRVRTKPPVHQSSPRTADTASVPVDAQSLAFAMIQALIPLGLHAVEEALQQEVLALTGPRYAHADGRPAIARWGSQVGSGFLADQEVPVRVPRVHNRATNTEVSLATYAQLQTPRGADVGLFRRVLGGLSCRDYEAAAEAVPEAFGLTKSSVSRRFVRASAKALQTLHERRHDDAEWLVLLLDGKSIADDQVVIALGVTTTGEQRILGLVQTATENKRVIAAFLRELVERGFQAPTGLLVARRRQGPERGRARGFRRGHPDLAEAQERSEHVPKTQHAPPEAEGGVREVHPRQGPARPAAARPGTCEAQRVRRTQPRGLAGRDTDAPSRGCLHADWHQLQDHEPDRERDGPRRSEYPSHHALADE